MWSIFCMDRATGQAVMKYLWAGPYNSCWELPAGAHRRGQRVDQLLTHGNRSSKIGHVLVSHQLFQICINQWMEPIIKHTSPLVQSRADDPQDRSLLVSHYGRWLTTVAALIFQTHTDDITNRDPGFCKHATNRRAGFFFVCFFYM